MFGWLLDSGVTRFVVVAKDLAFNRIPPNDRGPEGEAGASREASPLCPGPSSRPPGTPGPDARRDPRPLREARPPPTFTLDPSIHKKVASDTNKGVDTRDGAHRFRKEALCGE